MRKIAQLSIIIISIWLLSSEVAFAAKGDGPMHISQMTWFAINFSLYIAILYFLLRKPFVKFWLERRESIAAAVNKGAIELAQVTEIYNKTQSRLAELTPEKLSEISHNIESEGKKEADVIVQQAERKASFLKSQAELTLQGELLAAQVAVRQEIGKTVLAEVEKRVRTEYSEQSDAKRREQALSGVRSLL